MSRKLSKQEKEDQEMVNAMVEKAEKARAETKSRIHTLAMKRRLTKIWKPIVIKLHKDEKISDDRFSKLLNYLSESEFNKIEKYIKKKFPEYLEESESEDEKPKPKKKSGKGIRDGLIVPDSSSSESSSSESSSSESSSSESSSSESSSSESEEEKPRPRIIRKPLTKKKFSKKIEKEILDYLNRF